MTLPASAVELSCMTLHIKQITCSSESVLSSGQLAQSFEEHMHAPVLSLSLETEVWLFPAAVLGWAGLLKTAKLAES